MYRQISEYSLRKRLLVLIVLITFLFIGLLGKLVYVQIISSNILQAKALDQWTRDVPVDAKRGAILDINGIVLADTSTLYTVYVRPNDVKDYIKTALALSATLGLDYTNIYNKITSTRTSEITVKKGATKEELIILNSYNVSGVFVGEELNRYYPYGDYMTSVLGFVNSDGNGQTGLESYYDEYLFGQKGSRLTESDLIGRSLDKTIEQYILPVDGMNIRLTIDYIIQCSAESAVRNAMMKYNAKGASCIVMNADTGAIVAMAENPSFDLNDIPRDDISYLMSASRSTLVCDVYEPGSTFKIVTATAGLEEGIVTEDTMFYCPNHKIVDGQRIKCWKKEGHGSQTFREGVANSCNVVFMETALALGTEKMYEYIDKLGFTSETGIDVAGEAQAIIIPQKKVQNVDLARIGFGQAIAVTGIELISAMATIINGGYKVEPYLMQSVEMNSQVVLSHSSIEKEQVISTATSNLMSDLLAGVVNVGSGKYAKVDGYTIGGKTGTAQKYDENGAIAQGKYFSSFLGYLDSDEGNYVALMLVDEPEGWLYYGSLVAAPYVGDIFQNIVSYKNITPHYTTEELEAYGKEIVMPDLRGMSLAEARGELYKLGIFTELVGEGGTVVDQVPAPNSICTTNITTILKLSG